MKKERLTTEEREFFAMVAQAAFANPFGEERTELDRRITGTSASGDELVERVVAAVAERLHRLDAAGKGNLRVYDGRDAEILSTAFLFDVYHRFRGEFDAFILRQVKSDTPCTVPFARDLFGLLANRGFAREETLRYFAIFYQVRRAFYFIDTSLVGTSRCMHELRRSLWDNVFTCDIGRYETRLWDRMEDFSTLLLGETGTGKGAAAAAIGRSGFIPFDEKSGCFTESFARNFIAFNLSQYPESLLESELFGHRKGSFTGAIDSHEGIFSRCSTHGSIFLDEIGDVSIPVQIKLLQVLQERTFSPVGSHDRLRFNGRVIAATNRPLDELRRRGDFRDDFFYRLCSDIIIVPPLRARLLENPGELPNLVANILKRILGEADAGDVAMVVAVLSADLGGGYSWPGNVRELEQAVRRILLTRHYTGDMAVDAASPRDRLIAEIDSGTADAQSILGGYCRLLHKRFGTYEEVARRTQLDRRTVKKYVTTPAACRGTGEE
jgi:hypothetical protein